MLFTKKLMPVNLSLAVVLLELSGCANYASVTFDGPDYPNGLTRPAKLLERGEPGALKVQTVLFAEDIDVTARCEMIVMADGTLTGGQCATAEQLAPDAFSYMRGILERALYRTRAEPALLDGKPVNVIMYAHVQFAQRGEVQSLHIRPFGRFNGQSEDGSSIGAQRVLVPAKTLSSTETPCGPDDSFNVSGVIGADGVAQDLSITSNTSNAACEANTIDRIEKYVYIPAFDGAGNAIESRLDLGFFWPEPGRQRTMYQRRDRDAKGKLRPPQKFPLPGGTNAPVPIEMRGSQTRG